MSPQSMVVLGIETSCDETSAAVVADGCNVMSNVVHSQVALHGPYGGVVPEIASRSHIQALPGVVHQAVAESGLLWRDMDAIAVTYGPGLASSLLVGLSFGKGLAMRLGKPLVGVNHLHAHVHSVFLGADAPARGSVWPFVALVVSGGHTCLTRVSGAGEYELLGQTVDDAAGEAFDKAANLLGLGYPGGPIIDRTSEGGDPAFVAFPRGRQSKSQPRIGSMDPALCFSFSGLKTALLYYLKANPLSEDRAELPSLAASYQEAVVDALVGRCRKVLSPGQTLAVAGGVSLNRRLRQALNELAGELGVKLLLPAPKYCADNAAMIAGLAGTGEGVWAEEAMGLDVTPNLPLALVPA